MVVKRYTAPAMDTAGDVKQQENPPPRVLVVDDDPELRDFLQDILQDEGYEVTTAEHGEAALERLPWLSGDRPGLILLDMLMPVMSGIGFLERYRNIPAPKVPVLALTASHDAAQSAAGFGVEAMMKPFHLPDLLSLVDRYTTPSVTE